MVGLIGLLFPQVMGIGYGVTEQALLVTLPLALLVVLVLAKILATALSIGGGFGGGVFSPSLVIGALIGGAYGIIATSIFPDYSSGPAAYTVVGMGPWRRRFWGRPFRRR